MINRPRLNVVTMQPPARVVVSIPARLHLGFLDLNGGLGRKFGSIGLALDGVRTRLTLSRAAQTSVEGPDAERARAHLETMQQHLRVSGGHHVTVSEAVPPHAGLGSGTQLALAIASGLRTLHGLPIEIANDAVMLGRGSRSGIGIGIFQTGGLVVDGGRGADTTVPPVISRIDFPPRWRVLVILDPSRQGIHGAQEVAAFSRLPPLPATDVAHLCRLVLMRVLPAAAEQEPAAFGSAIKEIQMRLGDYFATAQGGKRFSSPDVETVLQHLDSHGAFGIGQSSWGPTGFAFASSEARANQLAALARQHPKARGLDIRICAGLNHGADIVSQPAGAGD